MNIGEAVEAGLTIKSKFPHYIPDVGVDDKDVAIKVSRAAREAGIHRTTIIRAITKGKGLGWKSGGSWLIRVKSYQKLVEGYRYGKLHTKTGHRWNQAEIAVIMSDMPHAEAARLLNRSYSAVKTKRCKLKASTNCRDF